MSEHPNAILMVVITPNGLSMGTMREILEANNVQKMGDEYDSLNIGDDMYFHEVMEDSYNESWQIAAEVGDLVFLNLATYGYGESIEWDKLEAKKNRLEEWAKETCKDHNCTYKIMVTANYW